MTTDSIIIMATILIGYISIIVMISQMNARFDSVNARIDDLRTEFKSDLNTLEIKLNTLLMGLFRDYYRPICPPPQKEDKTA